MSSTNSFRAKVIPVYRVILRELYQASIEPRSTRSRTTALKFRAILESTTPSNFESTSQNVVTFLRSQRLHKTLLDRYNPLFDLTAEERIEATAHRVGLNMPIMHQERRPNRFTPCISILRGPLPCTHLASPSSAFFATRLTACQATVPYPLLQESILGICSYMLPVFNREQPPGVTTRRR
ncbi:hypothetical protein EDB89DRAFT_1878019 [Lactarius sanguifluus]|nr:hypothetical protein EDB89DRAFT_1878019 [Lactarius sanguifluus]